MLLSCATGSEQFLGSEAIASYATAKAVILPIPYEATTTYRKGCETGPAAVITASQQLEAYDEELKRETCLEVGIYTHEAIADTRQQPQLSAEEMLAVTTATVSRLIADDKFVVAVGGEHAITTGVVQAYRQALSEPFTVVQIDAHGDMRFEYEGSLHNHACVMRRVLEMGLPTLPVGIRAICREEAELIAKQQIPVIWDRDIAGDPNWIEKAIAKITTEKVFLTIDVDGIDPALIPGVGTPEPGGLSWHQTLNFLRRLFQTHQVIGCDVMELAPISDSVVSEFTTAKLIYKLIGYQFTA
ncbi:MAG: agmatinase [Microcystis sp.]|jgi:agmatinase|uniref:agmatinase n=1 Tax=unclassified Microcystis TaxID=2643300 RepID=UPI002585BC38|nr:agmatinase [Microcystis sp. M49636_WE2]MDJ0552443.1 agmatinase [Microcystis sp. M49637_WE12]MDJ0588156.1 agmatinase [Microcystis sp. M49636_WE2]